MQLTDNFSLMEFERSQLAARHGIVNRVPPELMDNVLRCARMMQRIRDRLSALLYRPVPIIITSGYRCQQLNTLLGSRATSHHTLAAAADFVAAWGAPTPKEIVEKLAPRVEELGIGQLILEYPESAGGGWVHASCLPVEKGDRLLVVDTTGVRVYV